MEGISEARRRANIKSELEKVASLKGWEIPAAAIEICRKEDGTDYLLGEGGFGQVSVPFIVTQDMHLGKTASPQFNISIGD